MTDPPAKPLKLHLRTGDKLLIPAGWVEDQHGNLVRRLYDQLEVVIGNCWVEVSGDRHIRHVKYTGQTGGDSPE